MPPIYTVFPDKELAQRKLNSLFSELPLNQKTLSLGVAGGSVIPFVVEAIKSFGEKRPPCVFHIFMVDERMLPGYHPENTGAQYAKALEGLSYVHVHTVATSYEETVERVVQKEVPKEVPETCCDETTQADVENIKSDQGKTAAKGPAGCYDVAEDNNADQTTCNNADQTTFVDEIECDVITKMYCTKDVACCYEKEIRDYFGEERMGCTSFDLLILGMGPDGHTCSIFPGHPSLETALNTKDLVFPVYHSPKPPCQRVSFSYQLLNAAVRCVFLCFGASKSCAVSKVLGSNKGTCIPPLPSHNCYPAGKIALKNKESIVWYLDEEAACGL